MYIVNNLTQKTVQNAYNDQNKNFSSRLFYFKTITLSKQNQISEKKFFFNFILIEE